MTQAEARIGRPLTPFSVAGVARRTTRRAVWTGAIAGGAYGYGYGYPYGYASYGSGYAYPSYGYGYSSDYSYPPYGSGYGYGSYSSGYDYPYYGYRPRRFVGNAARREQAREPGYFGPNAQPWITK